MLQVVTARDPEIVSARRGRVSVREGYLPGGLPYLSVGSGEPLIYLCGSTPNHRHPRPGLQRRLALGAVLPFARAGYEVYFTNRWPGLWPGITWPEVAAVHAAALVKHFSRPVNVLGHSTGGSLALQLIADHPQVVRKAVIAGAAYSLGPQAREAQRRMLESVESSGRFSAEGVLARTVRRRWAKAVLRPPSKLASRWVTIDDPGDTIAMLRAEDRFDVRHRLPWISTETLVICGARDPFRTLDMYAETAYRMPNGRLIMYPGYGHTVVTKPGPVRDVVAFLRGLPLA